MLKHHAMDDIMHCAATWWIVAAECSNMKQGTATYCLVLQVNVAYCNVQDAAAWYMVLQHDQGYGENDVLCCSMPKGIAA